MPQRKNSKGDIKFSSKIASDSYDTDNIYLQKRVGYIVTIN